MIKIAKGREPKEWTEKRLTPGYKYSPIPELRDALLEEQGYLCAYCTCQINYLNSKIEHLRCRTRYPMLELNYDNMVICCHGKTDGIEHCDTKKASVDISFDIFSDFFFETISYKTKTGAICSCNEAYNNEINSILNLNCKTIASNRKLVIDGIVELLRKRGWSKSKIKKQLDKYSQRNTENKLTPYCGILIWYLGRKLKA